MMNIFAVTGGEMAVTGIDDGLPQTGQWRHGFALADMNADGTIDLVHGPERKGSRTPHIFLGDGHGRWNEWNTARFPEAGYDYGDAAAADLNGDGLMDIALAMHMTGIVVLYGEGDGHFGTTTRWITNAAADPAAFTSRALALDDWDGDGKLDLLCLGEGPRATPGLASVAAGSTGLRIFVNRDPKWIALDGPETKSFGDHIATGDFNGDGRCDAVMASHALGDNAVIALNQGGTTWQYATPGQLPEMTMVWSVATLEYDGKRADDVLLGYTQWQDRQRQGIARASWKADAWDLTVIHESDASKPAALATGDFDGDGHADLAAGFEDGSIQLWRGSGAGKFDADAFEPLAAATGRCYHLATADMDRDGRDELFGAFARDLGGMSAAVAGESETRASTGSLRAWRIQRRQEPADGAPVGDRKSR